MEDMSCSARRRTLAALLVVVALTAALVAGGCGETVIDQAKVEATIKENLLARHERIASVDCPSGVEVEPNATFKCTVNLAGGGTKTATLRIVDKKADLEMTGLSGGK